MGDEPPRDRASGEHAGPTEETSPTNRDDAEVTAALRDILRRFGIEETDPSGRILIERVEALVTHQGPIPPPEILERYDRVQPGLGAEIVGAWHQQRGHRNVGKDHARSGSARDGEK